MITVAVAGGTSPGVGRSIVTVLQQYSDQFQPIVLSRQSTKVPQWLEDTGIELCKVDYTSEESLYEALQGVHKVRQHTLSSLPLIEKRKKGHMRAPRHGRDLGQHPKAAPQRQSARGCITLRARRVRRRTSRSPPHHPVRAQSRSHSRVSRCQARTSRVRIRWLPRWAVHELPGLRGAG